MGEPGISLFQASDSINVNNSSDKDDEEELELQKQREEELKNNLCTEFDDWIDEYDDQSSLNSSHSRLDSHTEANDGESMPTERPLLFDSVIGIGAPHHTSSPLFSQLLPRASYKGGFLEGIPEYTALGSEYSDQSSELQQSPAAFEATKTRQHFSNTKPRFSNEMPERELKCNRGGGDSADHCDTVCDATTADPSKPNQSTTQAYLNSGYNSVDQLQVLYEVRLREIQRLNEALEFEKRSAAQYKKQMFRKLTLTEAEREQAVLSRTQAQEALGASKGKVTDLEQEVATLKQNVLNLEKARLQSGRELENARREISMLEQKLLLMEKCDSSRGREKNVEEFLKTADQMHQQQLMRLQSALDKAELKLNQKTVEAAGMESRLSEAQRTHETVMVERSEAVNQLSRQLEEAQAQCRQLLASNLGRDNLLLQNRLDDACRERDDATDRLKDLLRENEMLRMDLSQYESISKMGLLNANSSSDEADSIVQLTGSRNTTTRQHHSLVQSDVMAKLRDELHRALNGQMAKRVEIKRLQELVNVKEKQIQEMKKQEVIYRAETEALKIKQIRKQSTVNMGRREYVIVVDIQSVGPRQEPWGKPTEMDMEEVMKSLNVQKCKEATERNSEVKTIELCAELNKLKEDLSELRQRNTELEDENRDLKSKVSELEEAKARTIDDYNGEYMTFHEATVARLRQESLKDLQAKDIEYRVRLEQCMKECDEIKEQYLRVHTSKEQLSCQLAAERKERGPLLEERDKQLSAANEEVATLKRSVDILRLENELLRTEVKELRCGLNDAQKKTNIKDLESECGRLQKELSDSAERQARELSTVRVELESARERVVQLEQRLRREFNTEMAKALLDIDKLKAQLSDKEMQIQNLSKFDSRIRELADKGVCTEGGNTLSLNEQIGARIEALECAHRQALEGAVNKYKEQLGKAHEDYKKLCIELEKVEEKLKCELLNKEQLLICFGEEMKKVEERHQGQTQEAVVTLRELQRIITEKHAEMQQLNEQVNQNQVVITDLRRKVKEARKTAMVYKVRFNESKGAVATAREEYKTALSRIQSRIDNDIAEKEAAVDKLINEIQNDYLNRENELKRKLNKYTKKVKPTKVPTLQE